MRVLTFFLTYNSVYGIISCEVGKEKQHNGWNPLCCQLCLIESSFKYVILHTLNSCYSISQFKAWFNMEKSQKCDPYEPAFFYCLLHYMILYTFLDS